VTGQVVGRADDNPEPNAPTRPCKMSLRLATETCPHRPHGAQIGAGPRRLRLLSYNIQTGIATSKYHHYLTHSWKHVLPHPARLDNLDRMAAILDEFDIVGLQEADAGSLRSGFINLTEYLAVQARYPYWYDQTNRSIGKFAQHTLGLLSRYRPTEITEIRLPGMIPGRGALMIRFGWRQDALVLIILHLALGRRARLQQLGHIAELVGEFRHVVLMGDFNCGRDSQEMDWLLNRTELREPPQGLHTFPSWRPQRGLDHILVSPTLGIERVEVLKHAISDHLPIATEVTLPDEVYVAGTTAATAATAAVPLARVAGH
jgi:endonuclease/exonuclease/phosphatase family metal-dependent hydrolase